MLTSVVGLTKKLPTPQSPKKAGGRGQKGKGKEEKVAQLV
jgi:hypothetical protein